MGQPSATEKPGKEKAIRITVPGRPVPHYSTDGNDMLRLEEEVYKRRHVLDVSRYGKTWGVTWWSTLKGEGKVEVESADTMPEAVAMAAYRAITGKEW